MAYSKQTWTNGSGGGTPISADRLTHIEDGIAAATNPTGATANDVVESSKVTGDAQNRYERRADGSIAIGPGGNTPLKAGEAFFVLDLGTSDKEGVHIHGAEGVLNQILTVFDYLGAPIFSIPVDGGPAVFGDSFRIFGRQDGVFYPRHKLHHDGSVQINRGDAAGSVGAIAIGGAGTAPTRAPDGSEAGTVSGALMWADANGRLRVRRGSGPTDIIGGCYRDLFPPTVGVQTGDLWYNDGSNSLNFYNGTMWQRVEVDLDAKRVINGNYSVVNADGYGIILHSASTPAVTITLPSDATANGLPIETRIPWRQWEAGQITFAAGTGATVVGRGTRLKSAGQFAEGTVVKVAANTWLVAGDTVA